jgi:ATP-dependent helicase/nuclease subunit B
VVLEEELLARVAAAQAENPLAPVLVLVPTARLASHLQRFLAERNGALLAVEVLHYGALVERLLDASAETPPRLASNRLLLALLESVLRRRPRGEIARFASRRPGALATLLGTLRDLRKAGIAPARAAELLGGNRREAELARIYLDFAEALAVWETKGWTDEAGRAGKAVEAAGSFGARFREVLHHGAYELIGVHLDLLRAIDRASRVTVLLPVEPGAPASAYAESFARRFLLDGGEEPTFVVSRPGGLLGGRLADLYRSGSRPAPLAERERVSFRRAQGEAAEVTVAVRHALEEIRRGTPPAEIALVIRSLSPYAPSLEEALDVELSDAGPGEAALWTSSLGTPLRREPAVRDLLLLLRAARDDFPRGATAEILASPRLRWSALLPGSRAPSSERADAWSRRALLGGGLQEWTEDLPAWAERALPAPETADEAELAAWEERRRRRIEEARLISGGVAALAERLSPGQPRSWSEHARVVERLIREVLPGVGGEAPSADLRQVLALCEEMRLMGGLLEEAGEVPFDRMVDWLERSVAECELRPRARDEGGLRVLDAMQARGLTHRRVFLLGLHSGLFPRTPAEDPLLPDDARRRLREETGRPLPVKSEGEQEERLLLSLMLGSARERLDLSWQRADAGGRARAPSPALREVARLVLGSPELQALLPAPEGTAPTRELPAHPEAWLRALQRSPGLISPDESAVLAMLGSGRLETAAPELVERFPDLRHGLALLQATESFRPGRGQFDGRVGRAVVPERDWSVSSIERLGRCRLQFFFRDVLRIDELEAEARPDELPAWDLGERVHLLLERLYRTLGEEGLFEGAARGERLASRASELLASEWDEALGDLQERLTRRLPVLWESFLGRWREALALFVRLDLGRVVAEGWTPIGFEDRRGEALDLGEGVRLRVQGRFDRIFEDESGTVVGDYKTSGKIDSKVKPTRMIQARALQVPLYWLLEGSRGVVELLGVGPDYLAAGGGALPVARFSGFGSAAKEESFLETMRFLVALLERGHFPLLPGEHCSWCAYRVACRRNHPPTIHREQIHGHAGRPPEPQP